MARDPEMIEELYRDYWRYMIDRDADGLRGIMAKDYSLLCR